MKNSKTLKGGGGKLKSSALISISLASFLSSVAMGQNGVDISTTPSLSGNSSDSPANFYENSSGCYLGIYYSYNNSSASSNTTLALNGDYYFAPITITPTDTSERMAGVSSEGYVRNPFTTTITSQQQSTFFFDTMSTTQNVYGFLNYNNNALQINNVNFDFKSLNGNESFGLEMRNLSLNSSTITFQNITSIQRTVGISFIKNYSLSNGSTITFDSLKGDLEIIGMSSYDIANIELNQDSHIVFSEIKGNKIRGITYSELGMIYSIDKTSSIEFSNIEATKQDAIGISAYEGVFNLTGGGNITFSNITSPLTASGIYLTGYQNTNFTFDADSTKSSLVFTKISGGLAEGMYIGGGSSIGFSGNGEILFTSIEGSKIAYGLHSESTNKINFYTFDDKAKMTFTKITGSIASYGIYNNGNAIYNFGSGGISFDSIIGGKLRATGIYNHQGLMEISGSLTFTSISNSFGGVYGIQNNGDMILSDGSSITFGTPKVGESTDYKIYEGLGSTLELGNMVLSSSKDTTTGIIAQDSTTMLLQANKTLNFDLKSTTKEGTAFNGGNLILSSQSQVIFNSNGGKLASVSGNDGKLLLSGTSKDNRMKQGSSLLLRSLEVDKFNLNNSSIVLYADKTATIDTTNGFDGRAYGDDKAHLSQGGSDRIIINGSTLYTPIYNTLQITLTNFNETKTYVVLAEVDKSAKDTVIFNGLTQSGDRAKITSYAGFETQTLEIERYDDTDKTYYFSHLSTPSNSSDSGSSGGGDLGSGGSGSGSGSGSGGSQGGGSSGGSGGTGGAGGGSGSSGNGSESGNTGGTGGEQGGSSNEGNSDSSGGGSQGDSTTEGNPTTPNKIAINSDFSNSTLYSLHSNFSLLSANLNSLNKRMGDLRADGREHGVWARAFVGSLSLDFDIGTQDKNEYWTLQAGYDYGFSLEGSTNYLGFALSYTNSNTTQNLYSLQYAQDVSNYVSTNGVEFAIYNAYIAENGFYSDSILKASYLNSQLDFFNQSNRYDVSNYALTLSQELGYRFAFGSSNEWIITPELEVAYSYLNSTDFTQTLPTNHTMQVHQNAISLLRNRVGLDWRYDFSYLSESVKASAYIGTYYMYDFLSGGEISLKTLNDFQTHKVLKSEGRMVLNVGTDIKIYEQTSLYFDFEKSFFGKQIQTDYQVNFGVRYSFGEKLHTPIVNQEISQEENQAPLKIKSQEESEEIEK